MKPHIKRDRWRRGGWICRSEELTPERNLGTHLKTVYIGTGSTPLTAYFDWSFRVLFEAATTQEIIFL